MSELFIYLTNKTELDMVGDGYSIAPLLDINAPFYLLPSREQKSELDESSAPIAILILDEITIHQFRNEVLKIADKYGVIYVAYHTLGLGHGDEIDKVCSKIRSKFVQHFPPDPIYVTAVDFIKATSQNDVQVVVEKARNEFVSYDRLNQHRKSFDGNPL